MMNGDTSVMDLAKAVLIRWRLVSLLATVLFAVFVAGAFLLPPRYEASALIEILPVRGNSLSAAGSDESDGGLPQVAIDVVTLNTESGKLASESYARAVYASVEDQYAAALLRAKESSVVGRIAASLLPAKVNAKQDGSASPAAASAGTLVDREREAAGAEQTFRNFRRNTLAEALRGTRLIQITFLAPDPETAALVANAYADEYLQRKAAEATAFRTQLAAWLEGRLADLRGRVLSAERSVADYRAGTNLIEMGKETDQARRTPVLEELSEVLARLGDAKATRAEANARLETLRRLRGNPAAIASTPSVLGSSLVNDLLREEGFARRRLAELGASYGERHPLINRAHVDLAEARARIDQEIAKIVAGAEQAFGDASAAVGQLSAEVAKLQGRAAGEQRDRVGLRQLEREAGTEAELYDGYMRLARRIAEQQGWSPAEVSLVASATAPLRPVFPDKRLILPLGFIASLATSMLVGASAEFRRRRRVFVDSQELEQLTGIRLVGAIPISRTPAKIEGRDNEYALAIEDLALRLRGIDGLLKQGSRTIATMSAIPDEGKSVLAVALARWFANSGERVLVIDGDLRRPTISRILGVAHGHGVSGIQAVAKDIDILSPADDRSPSASKLLAELSRRLEQAKGSYDIIIVDTPALLAVPDALAIAGRCDEVVFVVRWASTPKDSVQSALRQLEPSVLQRTRAVFSMVDPGAYASYATSGSERYRYRISKRYQPLAVNSRLTAASRATGLKANES